MLVQKCCGSGAPSHDPGSTGQGYRGISTDLQGCAGYAAACLGACSLYSTHLNLGLENENQVFLPTC